MRKVVKFSLIVILVIWLNLVPSHSAIGSNEIVVTTEQELRDAMERPEAVIIIDSTIHINNAIKITEVVTIKGAGTITVSDTHRHFYIWSSGHLTLKGDIMLTRAEGYTCRGGGITIHGGNLTMYGGRIYGNAARNGGGVGMYINRWGLGGRNLGTFEMLDGEIIGNTAEFTGGGVFADFGIVNLQRGQIHSNTASGHGGIYVSSMWGVLNIGFGMRIFDNTPINTHDQESTSLFMRLITPDIYRFAAVVIIVLIGVLVSSKWQKRKQRKTPVE